MGHDTGWNVNIDGRREYSQSRDKRGLMIASAGILVGIDEPENDRHSSECAATKHSARTAALEPPQTRLPSPADRIASVPLQHTFPYL